VPRADHSSRGFLPSVVCLSVSSKPQKSGGRGPLDAFEPWRKSISILEVLFRRFDCSGDGQEIILFCGSDDLLTMPIKAHPHRPVPGKSCSHSNGPFFRYSF
jgi:hypothetical protein